MSPIFVTDEIGSSFVEHERGLGAIVFPDTELSGFAGAEAEEFVSDIIFIRICQIAHDIDPIAGLILRGDVLDEHERDEGQHFLRSDVEKSRKCA